MYTIHINLTENKGTVTVTGAESNREYTLYDLSLGDGSYCRSLPFTRFTDSWTPMKMWKTHLKDALEQVRGCSDDLPKDVDSFTTADIKAQGFLTYCIITQNELPYPRGPNTSADCFDEQGCFYLRYSDREIVDALVSSREYSPEKADNFVRRETPMSKEAMVNILLLDKALPHRAPPNPPCNTPLTAAETSGRTRAIFQKAQRIAHDSISLRYFAPPSKEQSSPMHFGTVKGFTP